MAKAHTYQRKTELKVKIVKIQLDKEKKQQLHTVSRAKPEEYLEPAKPFPRRAVLRVCTAQIARPLVLRALLNSVFIKHGFGGQAITYGI